MSSLLDIDNTNKNRNKKYQSCYNQNLKVINIKDINNNLSAINSNSNLNSKYKLHKEIHNKDNSELLKQIFLKINSLEKRINKIENKKDTEENNVDLNINSNNLEKKQIKINEKENEKDLKYMVLNNKVMDIIIEKESTHKEALLMKRMAYHEMVTSQMKFLILSCFTIFFALIGLLVFSITGKYILSPMLYIIIFFIGIGWGATAIASIHCNSK